MSTITQYEVNGMTCSHCVAAVTEEIGLVPGAESVSVELVNDGTSTVSVTSSTPIDRSLIRAAVEEAGYELAVGA